MRRRRYRKRPQQVRRDIPLQIECCDAHSDEPIRVTIGNEVYIFADDGSGRKVAPVFIEDHITCFLARADMYRTLGGGR